MKREQFTIIQGDPEKIKCEFCGSKMAINLPFPLSNGVKSAFKIKHEDCKPIKGYYAEAMMKEREK